MNTLGCLTLMLAIAGHVYGTAQIPDLIRFNDKEYLLFSTPLASFFGPERSKRPWFQETYGMPGVRVSSNERGYVATWQIEGKRLYLAEIDSWLCWPDVIHRLISPCRRFEIEDIFGKSGNRQKHIANWFSGTLRVPLGKLLRYVHMGFDSVYEREMLFEISNGIVASYRIKDNRDKPLPDGWDGVSIPSNHLKGQPIKPVLKSRLKTSGRISPGIGLGAIVFLGATGDQVASKLGKGENLQTAYYQPETQMVEYRSSRVVVAYGRDSNVVQAIYFHAGPRSSFVPTFKTDKGIGWASTVVDVRAANGEPASFSSGRYDALSTVEWKVLEYPGIEFRFENERLVRIGILPIPYEKEHVSTASPVIEKTLPFPGDTELLLIGKTAIHGRAS